MCFWHIAYRLFLTTLNSTCLCSDSLNQVGSPHIFHFEYCIQNSKSNTLRYFYQMFYTENPQPHTYFALKMNKENIKHRLQLSSISCIINQKVECLCLRNICLMSKDIQNSKRDSFHCEYQFESTLGHKEHIVFHLSN